MRTARPLLLSTIAGLWAGCSSPAVKPGAFDKGVLARTPLPATMIHLQKSGERIVAADAGWMALDTSKHLAFAGLRQEGKLRFCVVLESNPSRDRLVLLPLPADEFPLAVLANTARRQELRAVIREHLAGQSPGAAITCSLRRVMEDRRLGPPLRKPAHVYAAAANFPSHLQQDLAIYKPDRIQALRGARARMFQKHPPVPPPSGPLQDEPAFEGIIGPFDEVLYPEQITIPGEARDKPPQVADTVVDYEVEVGVVLNRPLDWDTVRKTTDRELMGYVAGYLLVSDTKARNPQVMGKARNRDWDPPKVRSPYLTGHDGADVQVGPWDKTSAMWWSHAASWGNYTGLGPFLIAAPEDQSMPSIAVATARSYADPRLRKQAPPHGRKPGTFYLRQCSLVTTDAGHPDRMLWAVPRLIRSLLSPDSALDIGGETARLEAGDIICLGTPGGTVITAKSPAFYDIFDVILFWASSRDWHDAFFELNGFLFLHPGDQVMYWGQGLGMQRHRIQSRPGFRSK